MSATGPLKSLSITAFRGSSSKFMLPFEKGRKLTLIYGENGTGKTTICDAFELLACEHVSSLDGYGLGGGLQRYWPTAGKNAADLSVTLETNAGSCSGSIVGSKVTVSPSETRPKIQLLRRQEILAFIRTEPTKRYEAIKSFIDIDGFETSEGTLRQQIRVVAEERTRAQQAEGQSLQELQGFYEAAGSPPGLNAVTWAQQKLTEPTTNRDAAIAGISKLRSAFDAIRVFPDRAAQRQKAVTDAANALTDAEAALVAAATAATEGVADSLALLEAGIRYLHAHPDTAACPLCGSKEKAVGLADDIAARLANLEALRTATAARQACATGLAGTQAAVDQVEADYASAIAAFAAVCGSGPWTADIRLPIDAPSDLSSLASWLASSETVAQTWAAVEASWRDEKKFTETLKAASDRYETNASTRAELDDLVPKLEAALKTCVEQRQIFTSKIISGIAQDVTTLYTQVHPDEDLGSIALPMNPARRASLDLGAKFSGKDVPPQAYFSQSHLDTLGLCVFIALAARDRPQETILILDDVLASSDEPHVERLVEMIYQASQNFRHTIVTTHYRPWREKFRWGVLKPDQVCQFVELQRWTLDKGMVLTGSTPEIVRLKGLLVEPNPDVQSIAAKAGVILEALLDFLTLKYGCAVPRRPAGSYTLGDLLPAVNGKLLAALKVETLVHSAAGAPTITATELKPLLEEIRTIAQARNVMGAHFKQLSFGLYPDDGIRFARLVEQLSDTLICPDHGWPNRDKSGSYWNNGGDTRRLHPLQKPA